MHNHCSSIYSWRCFILFWFQLAHEEVYISVKRVKKGVGCKCQTLQRDGVLVKYNVWCDISNNQRARELAWLMITLIRSFSGKIIHSYYQILHCYSVIFQTTPRRFQILSMYSWTRRVKVSPVDYVNISCSTRGPKTSM